jgi:hypothetical protein
MKRVIAAAAVLALAATLSAGPLKGHKHMKEAHNKILAAIHAMEAAQKANAYDLGGHAAKAEQLLRDAEKEITLAADTANENKK